MASAGLAAQVLAADGATSGDVLRRQLPLIASPPALVTLTVGGNDLMSHYGDTQAAYAAIDAVTAAVAEIVTRLAAAGRFPVVLTTVYDPSDGTGHVPVAGLPPWPQGPAVQLALSPPFVLLVVLIGGAALITTGGMAPADLVPFLLLGLGLTAPVAALGHGFDDMQAARRAVGRIRDVLAVPSLPEPAHPVASQGHRVELRDVRFGYEADHEVPRCGRQRRRGWTK